MRFKKRKPAREVRIDRFDAQGRGEGADANGRRWSVRGAPVGSTVLTGGKEGVRLGMVQPAADAVTPPCAVFGVCGGCQWQEMPLARQREEKHAALQRLLEPLGGVDHGMLAAEAGYGYRNKIELTFGVGRYLLAHELNTDIKREGRWLGFHAPGRYDRIVDTPDCNLASPAINKVYARIRADVYASGFAFWCPNEHVGFFRNLVLREGTPEAGGEAPVLVALYTFPGDDAQASWLRARAPTWGAACVGWFENAANADAAIGDLREVLVESGQGLSIRAMLGGVHFQLSPTAFFQVNVPGAELLVSAVRRMLGTNAGSVPDAPRVLWDLYCGAGLLGLACAAEFDAVYGIESVAAAIDDARRNAVDNGITNATFAAGNVENLLSDLPSPTAIIVDPPRNGLHADALRVLATMASYQTESRDLVLVYVACKPSSLLRDGVLLKRAGWVCTDWVAVDLFPQTVHVEVVTRWVVGFSGG
jgi:23S rRNA (uracil1939-C5)-methyltransferase